MARVTVAPRGRSSIVLCVLNCNHSAGLVVMGLLLMGYCSTADRSGSGADGATQCRRLRRRDHEPSAARPPHRHAPGTGPVLERSVLYPLRRSLALPRWCSAAQRYSPPPSTHCTAIHRQKRFWVGTCLRVSRAASGFKGIRALRADVLAKEKCLAQVSQVASRFHPCAALRCAAYSK